MSKECTQCNTTKALSEFYPNKRYSGGHIKQCIPCHKKYAQVYYQKHKVRLNKKKCQWARDNKGAHNATSAKRRASVLQQTPAWADQQYIKDLYSNADEASRVFNVPFHVDHIVPLQGKTVRGLHCEFNMQIITATENLSKSNREDTFNEQIYNSLGCNSSSGYNLCVR